MADVDFSGVAASSGGATDTSVTPDSPQGGGTPGTTIDYSDDMLIKGVPGFNEPVRYGDLYKRQQADYTRKTQLAAAERQRFQSDYQKQQSEIKAERQRLEGLAQTLLQRQTPQGSGNGADPLFQKLASAEYINGSMMAEFITNLQEKGLGPIVKAFQERDQITQGMYQQVLELRKQVQELVGARSGQEFDGKISRWLSEGGYPTEASQLAKEIYLAYEGDDLDNEFPLIFKERWDQLQNILRAQDRKRVDDAKRQSVRLPGKGGNGSMGRPVGLKGHEKARDIASSLWDAIQTAEPDA